MADPAPVPPSPNDVAFGPPPNLASGQKAFWPIDSSAKEGTLVSYLDAAGSIVGSKSRMFHADRPDGSKPRFHAGIDLFAKPGDEVVACEDGTVVDFFHFLPSQGEMTFALLVQNDSGRVINYGEVDGTSLDKFGLFVGAPISAGQTIALIGATGMLHFEMYKRNTIHNEVWFQDEPAPPDLLNPTKYLLALQNSLPPSNKSVATTIPDDDTMLEPAPGSSAGPSVPVIVSRPAHSNGKDDGKPSSSATSGFKGTQVTFSDGTVVITGEETATAIRGGQNLGPLAPKQRRVTRGDVTTIEQVGYAHNGREFPVVRLERNHGPLTGDGVVTDIATTFGRSDSGDGGTGSPALNTVQTCSEVFGVAYQQKRLETAFGKTLKQIAHTPALLNAMVEVFNPNTRNYARVPIVDIGPGTSAASAAKIDLTGALDKFLGTGGKETVQFRLIV